MRSVMTGKVFLGLVIENIDDSDEAVRGLSFGLLQKLAEHGPCLLLRTILSLTFNRFRYACQFGRAGFPWVGHQEQPESL